MMASTSGRSHVIEEHVDNDSLVSVLLFGGIDLAYLIPRSSVELAPCRGFVWGK
jgi:hypothetical protein